jgi:hypothetical protein
MATSKQMKERSALLHEITEQLGEYVAIEVITEDADIPVFMKQVEYKYRTDVYALALARGYIKPSDVPPNKAREVAEKFLKKAPDRIRDDKGRIGTEVHGIIEELTFGEVVEFNQERLNHIKAWRQFMRDWDMEILMTEFVVEGDDWMGTGDFLGRSRRYPELGLILGDYKTSESGIWEDIALQLAGLRYGNYIIECLAKPHPDGYEHKLSDVRKRTDILPRIDSFIGVQIVEGGYQVDQVNVTEATFKVFQAALIVATWKTDYEKFALKRGKFVPIEADK